LPNRFLRTKALLGGAAIEKLKKSSVAVFGIGGVGSFAVEALSRGGVGNIEIIDGDLVDITNINRQLIALSDTVGQKKVDVMAERIKKINPNAAVTAHYCFYDKNSQGLFDLSKYNYIIDAIDTITSKLLLIENANKINTPIISCMGAGNKIDPTALEVADIFSTSVCPLARIMRRELKIRKIASLLVVYSKEMPIKPRQNDETPVKGKNQVPGSVSFVPPVAGFMLAGEVIKALINTPNL